MTAQLEERLIYQGVDLAMCSEPLDHYFALVGSKPNFARSNTALWRNYIGTWEILDDKLYIIGLKATMHDGSAASLETVFPDFPNRVFADWYSGELRVPRGKLIQFVHMGYSSKSEEDLFLTIANGMLTGTGIIKNSIGENEADGDIGIPEFLTNR
ncbi:MAG: hypothetical protein WC681_14350 [Sterolibacterium sp.]|jgi:hypothetical protein